jgi:hypothetical protein
MEVRRVPENEVKEDPAMSVQPTRLARAGVLAVAAGALIMPSAALAHHKGGHEGKPEHPGNSAEAHAKNEAKKEGKKDNGKKLGHNAKGDGPRSETEAAPAAAPVAASAPSQSPVVTPPCTSKRYFKITLGRRANVRRARVLLNGKIVTVSYGKRKVTARIDLRNRVKGTYVVRTVVVTKRLRIRTGTRRYRVCGG